MRSYSSRVKTGKIRTVRGPLGGKTYYLGSDFGRNEIELTGPKRMTREQKWKHHSNMASQGYPWSLPTVRARYRLAMRVVQSGNNFVNVPCMHPDGSYFYEYVEGSAYDRDY